jgi:protein-tyrosine kinase
LALLCDWSSDVCSSDLDGSDVPVIESSATSKSTRAGETLKPLALNLDDNALDRLGLLPPADQRARLAAQYRSVKRQLINTIRTSRSQHDRMIVVTSALAGEGKTFTSINLALSLARERDYSVLLIDGDVVKPTVSRLLGVDKLPGLLDAVRSESTDVEELLVKTTLRGFGVLSAGSSSGDTTEELASASMARVCARLLAQPSRIVVVDSPPLLLTTEAQAIAQHMGQVIVVVDAHGTPQRAVLDAIDALGERRGVQLVLNRATRSTLQTYYYGYGDGTSYGQTHDGG